MVLNLSEYHDQDLITRLERPDFKNGANARETANFFGFIGRPDLAESVWKCIDATADDVVFILAHPTIGGYKRHGEGDTSYVNILHLGTRFGELEVPVHEEIHNEHEKNWGKLTIPGWSDLSPERQRAVLSYAGVDAITETELIESLTQYATQVDIHDTESGYDHYVVPAGMRVFRALEKLSGKSMIGGFLNMALHGSRGGKQEFADGVRIGANAIFLEAAFKQKNVYLPGEALQDMIRIIEEQRKDFVVRDLAHAEQLVTSYLEAKHTIVVGTTRKVRGKVTHLLPLAA